MVTNLPMVLSSMTAHLFSGIEDPIVVCQGCAIVLAIHSNVQKAMKICFIISVYFKMMPTHSGLFGILPMDIFLVERGVTNVSASINLRDIRFSD